MKQLHNNIFPWFGLEFMNVCGILFIKNGAKVTDKIINHESIHIEQMKEMLYIFFYLWYVIEWLLRSIVSPWTGGDPYTDILFEQEAYENDDNLDYLKTRKHFSWIKYLWK